MRTECRCTKRMADMFKLVLLTSRSKSISRIVAAAPSVSSSHGPALPTPGFSPFPPPSVRAHPADGVSSSLAFLPYSRFGFGPVIRLQFRLEPLFLRGCRTLPRLCMAAFPASRLCAPPGSKILQFIRSQRGLPPAPTGQPLRRPDRKALPIPSGRAFCFA
jgi:hypothetical protein